MELSIYDFSGNNLGYCQKVISSYRDTKFNQIGTSEFHIDINDPIAKIIKENQFLILEQDNFFQDIIIGSEIDEDFVIYCRSLNWLLSKMIVPPISESGKISHIVHLLLESSYGCNINLGSMPVFSKTVSFQTSQVELFSDALSKCLNLDNGGHSLRFSHDDNSFYLDILKGNSLDFYISKEDGTLDSISIYDDILDMANSPCLCVPFTVISSWDPVNNSPALSNNKSANFGKCYRVRSDKTYSRFNLSWEDGDYIFCDSDDGKWKRSCGHPRDYYIYKPDSSSENIYQWFFISNCETEQEAAAKLSQMKAKKKITAKAKNIEFNKDYSLGDEVRLQYTLCDETHTALFRFSSVIINHDYTGKTENPTLEEVN